MESRKELTLACYVMVRVARAVMVARGEETSKQKERKTNQIEQDEVKGEKEDEFDADDVQLALIHINGPMKRGIQR